MLFACSKSKIMKLKLVAILTLVALSCQKEKMPEQATLNSSVQTENAKASEQLTNDPNFVKLYNISLPIFNALQHGRNDLTELTNDGKITFKECKTLAPKLGFKDSAALVNYFNEVYKLAPKIAKAHPNMTSKQCLDAVTQLNQTNLMSNPCQDGVIGQFTMDVAECAALGLIPLVGEVLAGTCMVGALVTYNSGMQQCAGGAS